MSGQGDASAIGCQASVRQSVHLLALIERLAENAQENWAANRIKDSWVYGPMRDDSKKYHLCLVSYADLSGSGQEYHRKIATESLKSMIALSIWRRMGFSLRRQNRSARNGADDHLLSFEALYCSFISSYIAMWNSDSVL